MNPLLYGEIITQRHRADIDAAGVGWLISASRRSRTQRAAVDRARARLNDALARREADQSLPADVVVLAP